MSVSCGFLIRVIYPQTRRSSYLLFNYLSYYLSGEGLYAWKTPPNQTNLWK